MSDTLASPITESTRVASSTGRCFTHGDSVLVIGAGPAGAAVRAMSGEGTREQIWQVNADDEHHEGIASEDGPR
jgi:threonine dehydrogenase-like Zn-dependent dehydrogenase